MTAAGPRVPICQVIASCGFSKAVSGLIGIIRWRCRLSRAPQLAVVRSGHKTTG
ncbi:hypothetical protein HanOQP8_Chr12g0449301 [Helianthus annuus]|nr:hypothetical protein HanOQP8_Chr12g0449301 [Helianthus annuus]